MKWIILILALVLGGEAWATNYCNDTNAVGCWLFREGSGTTVDDSTSNNNIGTFRTSGGPAWSSMLGTGAPSYATYMVTFNGSNDYIQVSQNASINNLVDYTYIVWINPTNTTASSGLGRIYDKRNNGGNEHKLVYLNGANPAVVYLVVDYDTIDINTHTGSGEISWLSWTHLTQAHSGASDKKSRIYVGGTLKSTSSAGATDIVNDNAEDLFIGNRGSIDRGFNGSMTEFALFSRVLNSTEINDIMDNGLSPSSTSHTSYFRNAILRNGVFQ